MIVASRDGTEYVEELGASLSVPEVSVITHSCSSHGNVAQAHQQDTVTEPHSVMSEVVNSTLRLCQDSN